ncbi:MAG: NPCBM/NEW2 domain-containing protein [bacterium]|nr:NPCBM/NEW2 domain-containing protein [bacterium]
MERKNYILFLILFLALLLRLLLIPNPGFEADVAFWKSWGLGPFDHGIVWGLHNTNINYPAPFAYLLWFMVWIYSWFADPHNFNEFWSNTNVLFLFISKLPSILADFGIAGIIVWVSSKFKVQSSKFSYFLASLYLLNPVSLIDGAWWGQVDSLGVFVFLLAVMALLKKKPFWAGFIYVVAVMTKLQNMIYGPLFFLFLWQEMGFVGLIRGMIGGAFAFFGLNIEFLLARDMGRVIGSLVDNYDYFPLLSLNAYNLWWITAKGAGMQVSDKILTIGIINAKTMGLLIFSSFYVLALLNIASRRVTGGGGPPRRGPLVGIRGGKRLAGPAAMEDDPQTLIPLPLNLRRFFESLILVVGAFFLFQTQSHDRYAFPIIVFLLLWATEAVSRKRFTLFYALFSLLYFYNLHTSLAVNYAHNALPVLRDLTQPIVTITTATLLLGLFSFFILHITRRKRIVLILPIAFFLISILVLNRNLITKKPISLTALTPKEASQDYGLLTKNMPVSASQGFSYWSPLSVQYAFYRKGLGTHAKSRLVYDLGGHFKTFETDYGIDTQAGDKASAVFQIYLDGNRLFESGVIRKFDLPRHATVDVSRGKLLELVTTDAGDGINDDHTDWLNPKLLR